MPKKGALRERTDRLWRSLRGRLWQLRNRRRLAGPRPRAGTVWFATPLVSRQRAQDWAGVEARLKVTVGALLAQTDGRWQLTVCGQDRPSSLPDDPRIRFVKAEISDRFYDKWEKNRLLSADLVAEGAGAGYFFPLDADDIVHPRLVEHLLSDDNGQGYLIERGYILDAGQLEATGAFRIGLLCPPTPELPGGRAFYRACGSCAALWYDLGTGADFRTLFDRRGSHHQLAENLADFGFTLAMVPFPAAIYVVNHGANMRQRRGMGEQMPRLVARTEMADPAAVVDEFGLHRLFGLPQDRVSSGG